MIEGGADGVKVLAGDAVLARGLGLDGVRVLAGRADEAVYLIRRVKSQTAVRACRVALLSFGGVLAGRASHAVGDEGVLAGGARLAVAHAARSGRGRDLAVRAVNAGRGFRVGVEPSHARDARDRRVGSFVGIGSATTADQAVGEAVVGVDVGRPDGVVAAGRALAARAGGLGGGGSGVLALSARGARGGTGEGVRANSTVLAVDEGVVAGGGAVGDERLAGRTVGTAARSPASSVPSRRAYSAVSFFVVLGVLAAELEVLAGFARSAKAKAHERVVLASEVGDKMT